VSSHTNETSSHTNETSSHTNETSSRGSSAGSMDPVHKARQDGYVMGDKVTNHTAFKDLETHALEGFYVAHRPLLDENTQKIFFELESMVESSPDETLKLSVSQLKTLCALFALAEKQKQPIEVINEIQEQFETTLTNCKDNLKANYPKWPELFVKLLLAVSIIGIITDAAIKKMQGKNFNLHSTYFNTKQKLAQIATQINTTSNTNGQPRQH
jgi:hypothetical protein